MAAAIIWFVAGVIHLYGGYIFLASVYLYSNARAKGIARRARRSATYTEGRKEMVRQPITTRRSMYGINRVSGPITFMHVSSSKQLYILITLSGHEVSAIEDVYFNDVLVDMDSSGVVTGRYANNAVIKKGLGSTSGDADLHAYLISEVPDKWTVNHLQTGCAKLLVRLAPNRDVYAQGIPNISCVVHGKKLYDPRTTLTAYSDNAALCIRDYLTDTSLGLGATTAEIDDTVMVAAANISDESVAVSAQANTFTAKQISAPVSPNNFDWTYGGGGSLEVGPSYSYKVTFYDSSGETDGGVASQYSSGSTGALRLTEIPVGPSGATGRKIYRASSNVGVYYLAGTIADLTTTTFIDDGSLSSSEIPVANTTNITDTITRDSEVPFISTGIPVTLTTTGTLPAPLATATTYYYIYVDYNSGKLATTRANALSGTAITRTTAGSGVHSITHTHESRYTLNGPVDSGDTPKSSLEVMLTSCAGKLLNPVGKWTLYVGAYRTPTITFDENYLDGPIKVTTRLSKRELANGVKGVYVDPAKDWQPTDFPPVTNATYKSEDNNESLWNDVEFPFTITPSMAQRLSKIELERGRQQIATTWPCKLTVLSSQVCDVVNLTNTRLGWSAKPFEINDLKFVVRSDGDVPRLGVDLSLRETASGVYDWNSGEETLVDLAPNTNLPDATIIAVPAGLTVASGTNHLFTRSDGTIFTRAYLTWTSITDEYVRSGGVVEIQYRKVSSTAIDWEKATSVPGAESSAYVLDVEDGIEYLFRIRAVNNIGVRSYWTAVLHTVIGKTEPPATVLGFSAGQNGNVVVLKWTQVADIDLAGYEIRYITQGVSNWDAAIPLTKVTRGTQITSAALPPGSWTLLIAARDTSGNYSTTKSSYDIDVTNALDIIYQLEQAPDWLGTKTNFVHHWTGVLIPDSQDAASLDTWDTFDIFVPNPFVTCTYESTATDIGFIDTVRVWASSAAALGPGVVVGFPDPTLDIDYHSGSGYDGFEAWTIGDVTAQYLKEKMVLLTSSGVAYVSSFKPTLDVAEHTESAAGVVIGASGTAITFTNRFHFTPNIQLTVQGGTGYTASFTAQSATGFTAHVYNSSGTEVGGIIDWSATGD